MAISGVTDYTNTYAANYAGATKGAKDTLLYSRPRRNTSAAWKRNME